MKKRFIASKAAKNAILLNFLPTLGDELPVNERQLVFGRNGSLVLKKILPTDAGTYTCTVTAPQVSDDDKHPPPRASQDISISVMGKLLRTKDLRVSWVLVRVRLYESR